MNISTPYSMKMVIMLPAPLGVVCAGKIYPVLTSICFLSMTNGIDLTNGLDGLVAGTAALAFIGMSIMVLPICSDLAIFGSSMAGACVRFLFQNRYKASILMGDMGFSFMWGPCGDGVLYGNVFSIIHLLGCVHLESTLGFYKGILLQGNHAIHTNRLQILRGGSIASSSRIMWNQRTIYSLCCCCVCCYACIDLMCLLPYLGLTYN